MAAEELLLAFGRATVFTSASAVVAWLLLRIGRVDSPRIHRAAWFLVVAQGWLLFPWVWQIETAPIEAVAVFAKFERSTNPMSPADTSASFDAAQAKVGARSNWELAALAASTVWFVGATLLAISRVLRYVRFVRQLPAREANADGDWQREWQRQLHATRIRRRVELRMTGDLGPLLCYVPFRYMVLVPRALWSALTRSERQVIIRHELAHLVRGDLWWALAIRVLALPQWFNPLVWRAVRGFDEAGEWACDDLVARRGRGHELLFARSLLATAEYATAAAPGTLAMQGGELSRRIRRLVSHRFKEETMAKKLWVLVPLAAIVAAQLVRIEHVAAKERGKDEPAMVKSAQSQSQATNETDRVAAWDILEITADHLVARPTYRVQVNDRLKMIGRDGGYGFGRVDNTGQIENWRIKKAAGLTLVEVKQGFLELHQGYPEIVPLEVVEFGNPISGSYCVSGDCAPWLPILGKVPVGGCTADEAQKIVVEKLSDQFESPLITVRLRKKTATSQRMPSPPIADDLKRESLLNSSIRITPDPYEYLNRTPRRAMPDEELQRIEFSIAIVEDPENALAEFGDVRTDPSRSSIDTQAILPALRILAKHNVITMLTVPRIVCRAGEAANIETTIAASRDKDGTATNDLRFEVYGGELDGAIRLGYKVEITHKGKKMASYMSMEYITTADAAQTLLIKAHVDASGRQISSEPPPTYIVLTPKIVSGAGKRRRGFDGFTIAQ